MTQTRQEILKETSPSVKTHPKPTNKKIKSTSKFECDGGANDYNLTVRTVSELLTKNNMYPYKSPTKDESEEKVDYKKFYFESLTVNTGLKATV